MSEKTRHPAGSSALMKLYEYMAKEVFNSYGIPTPRGSVATTADEVEAAAEALGVPVVVKVQILAGGRGKAGGIKFAQDPDEARRAADELLGMNISGFEVERLLVEERINIDGELYLGITVDAGNKCPVIIASSRGGISIEEVPQKYIVREEVPVQWGLYPYQVRSMSERIDLSGTLARQFDEIALALYSLFRNEDAELTEINPLVVSGDRLIAADARLNVDEYSSFRHDYPDTSVRGDVERRVTDIGLSYVQLDGDVAVLANGAGATMATMDILQRYGSSAMNFLDVGGGADVDSMAQALRILADTRPGVLLINIFGGITRCDDVAEAVVRVRNEGALRDPIVVRLVGTNEEEGLKILAEAGVTAFQELETAARKAAELALGQDGEVDGDGCSGG